MSVRKPLQQPPAYDLDGNFIKASVGLPHNLVHTPVSLYTFPAMGDVAEKIGLAVAPEGKIAYFPKKPETERLQWGFATDNSEQIAFEIGTSKSIVSLHFRKAAAKKDTPWHLDVVEIDTGLRDRNGPVTFHIPCDEEQYEPQVKALFACVSGTTTLMAAGDMAGAAHNFMDHLAPIVRHLDVVSEIMEVDHEADFRRKYGLDETPRWHP
ncbi:MAG: hypothetical protein KGQ41_06310 [Alphaproteobacteria bacterium]|nr:hypothetical protein [Alphaproteobacteria bacterium]